MNEQIRQLAEQAKASVPAGLIVEEWIQVYNKNFAELIVQECIDKIETHRIPVGNSAAGEMACEMTYSALMEIRDEIKLHFGVEE